MNEMDYNRDYDYRNYDYRDYDHRRYNNRNYDYRNYGYRDGRYNRNYRNYREQDYYGEIEMIMEDIREQYRRLEDISEMAHNTQDENVIKKIAEKEKETYTYLKQILDKQI